MKRIIIALALAVVASATVNAKKIKDVDGPRYNRSSIYSILINHTEQKFASEIKEQFLNIPVPDQYDDHDLNVKVVNVSDGKEHLDSINAFIEANHIASRMVAKWFNRDILTGQCSTSLVEERGIYNASELDKVLAEHNVRGYAMLADAGEELIGHSFLLVNEIKYVDKGKTTSAIGAGLKILGSIGGAFLGSGVSDLGNLAGNMVASIKGFKVKITTHLYQLQWDDEAAAIFYEQCYSAVPDETRRQAFEANRDKFHLKYIGQVESSGSTTSFMGINESEPYLMVRKACQRALDENVVDLQKNYDQFRVKAPVQKVGDNEITAAIGMKEGITKDSKYEVLEAQIDKDGKTVYKRIAIVRPVENKIWDNRYMATEEMAYGAGLGATTFKKESGGDIYSGHLLRQID